MALTAGNVTLKLAGGDYSTWTAFWDDIGNLTDDITCIIDDSAFTETSSPGVLGESLNGHTLHVKPASFPTTTDATTGPRFSWNVAFAEALRLDIEGPGTFILEGLVQKNGTEIPYVVYSINNVSTQFTCIIRRNIFLANRLAFYHQDATVNAGLKLYNNIFTNCTVVGAIQINVAVGSAVITNNTVNSCNDCVNLTNNATLVQNCISYSKSVGDRPFWQLATAIGFNNASSDATANGWGGGSTDSLINIGDPFNNRGVRDFTITAEGVIGKAGLDLSGDFTDDFFGVTRSNWTIGACEFVSTEFFATAEATAEAEIEIGVSITHPVELTVFAGHELVVNGNMELDSDWDNQASPAANVRSDEQAHSGIYSRKITLDGIGSFGGIISADEIPFVVGNSYIITGWAYNLNMSNGERLVMDCTQFSAGAFSIYPNQGVWTQWSEVVVATETSGKILFYNFPTDIANANASYYVDAVSIPANAIDVGVSVTVPSESTVEPEIAIDLSLQTGVEATVEPEIEVGLSLTHTIEATVEPEITIVVDIGKWIVINSEMDFAGALSGNNPAWLTLDDKLTWIGEWDATYGYVIDDVVIYKASADPEWHVFVSKIIHNVGNNPDSSAVAWRRLYQEPYL